jgi:membrane-bound metal-dependent hydrolase YbcI (DUF457 family)
MPSPIGHLLAGAAVSWSLAPRAGHRLAITAAALAALPDADLATPLMHRTVTHSVGAVAAVTIIAVVVTRQVTPRAPSRAALVCAAAYASHLLLDWLGTDRFFPYGLQMLWPFSDRFYISGWDVFLQTARGYRFTWPMVVQNAKAMAWEIAILAPILAVIWLVRVKPAARLAAEMPGRNHPAQ